MRKLLKITACFALLFSLGACSTSKVSEEALDQLEASLGKIGEYKSFNFDLGVVGVAEGQEVKLNGSFLSEDGIELALKLQMDGMDSSLGLTNNMEFYLKDDFMYMNLFGMKQKQEMKLSELQDTSTALKPSSYDRETLKELFEEATLDGNTLHLVLDKEKLNSAGYADALENLAKNSAGKSTDMPNWKNFAIDLEIKDDFITKMTITLSASAEGEDVDATIVLNFTDINSVTSISYPEDLDTYQESTYDASLYE